MTLLFKASYFMNALEITKFTKRYGNTIAVNNIDLVVKEGEFFGFLGPNGAGKSTTIHCITGVNTIDEGEIRVFGIDAKHQYKEARRLIGLSPQEFNVDIFEKVYNILWYVAGLYGVPSAERDQKITILLKKFDLEKYSDRPFRELSGGMKRRVLLARAMVHDPKLLILDEPTAGVDVELRHVLWGYLQELNKQGKTIILTSHYLEEVELLCNRIAIINKGEIITIGDKADFLKDGKTLEKTYLELTKREKGT